MLVQDRQYFNSKDDICNFLGINRNQLENHFYKTNSWLELARLPGTSGDDPTNFDPLKVAEYKQKAMEESSKRQIAVNTVTAKYWANVRNARILLASKICALTEGTLNAACLQWIDKHMHLISDPKIDGVISALVQYIVDTTGIVSVELYHTRLQTLQSTFFQGGNPVEQWTHIDSDLAILNQMASMPSERIEGPTAILLQFIRYFGSYIPFSREIGEIRQRLQLVGGKICELRNLNITNYDQWVETETAVKLPVMPVSVTTDSRDDTLNLALLDLV